MLLQVETAHPGHLEIDDQALRKTMRQCRKKISPGFECLYTEATRPKQPPQTLEHGWIIINYGNPGRNFRHERLWRRNWSAVGFTVGPIRPHPYFGIWPPSPLPTDPPPLPRPT